MHSKNVISILVADDEFPQRKLLKAYIDKIDQLHLVATCSNGLETIKAIEAFNPAIVLLDIEMPEINGLEVARIIKNKNIEVVFITAYSRYAINGFEVRASDYLLKPLSFEKFVESITRITQRIEERRFVNESNNHNRFITVRSEGKNVRLYIKEILYIEGLKEYVRYIMRDGTKVIALESLKALEENLPSNEFIRCHKSYIVNIQHIKSYNQQIVNIASTDIPVGTSYKDGFMSKVKKSDQFLF